VAGTVSNPLLLASDIVAGLLVVLLNVTVQALDALLPSVDGVQATEVSCTGATKLNVLVRLTLPALAVTIAD